jgi:hypothetical protein
MGKDVLECSLGKGGEGTHPDAWPEPSQPA